jgi:PAS domain S-box-containing protein
MSETSFLALVQNASLLLAVALLFDLFPSRRLTGINRVWQVPLGFALGGIGITLMLTPWVYSPGVIFDTRSVLLAVSGLFFGTIPTILAMLITGTFRIYQGGTATWMGVCVILTSGLIGILYRNRFHKPLDTINPWQIYFFGVVVHLAMLACTFVLPFQTARQILADISLPVLTIYPLGTFLLGWLMVNHLRREKAAADLYRAEARLRTLVNISQHPAESVKSLLDYALNQAIQLTDSKIGYIYSYSEENQEFELNTWSREVMEECNIPNSQTNYELAETGIWGEVVRQRKPILVNDFTVSNPLRKGVPEGHAQLRKFLSIPILNKGAIIAVVGVANKETDYGETDILQLTLLMDGVWKVVEQKQAEKALTESEASYRRVVDTAQEGIWILDSNQKTNYVNPRLAQMLGYESKEIVGFSMDKFIYGEDQAEHLRRLRERKEGKNDQYEFRFRKKDGNPIWTIISATAILDPRGQFLGAFAMFTDITRMKRDERILQARLHLLEFSSIHPLTEVLQETLHTIGGLVNSPIGFYHFLESDQKTLSLRVWSTPNDPQSPHWQGEDPHYRLEGGGIWKECIRERRKIIINDFTAIPNHPEMPAEHVQIFREMVVPVFRGSLIVAVLGVGNKPSDYDENDVDLVSTLADLAWDIAEQKRAEENIQNAQFELKRLLTETDQSRRALLSVVQDQKIAEDKIRQMNQELEQRVRDRTIQLEASNKELEAFAYSVSHDLRAPLRALDGFSNALVTDYRNVLDDQGKHFLARIQEASQRMGQLIEDLLNLSRITRCEINLEPVDLTAMVKQITDEFHEQAPDRRVKFEISPGLNARGDQKLIRIALENLLSNAFKFTRNQENAIIEVGKLEKMGECVFFVRDNGVGFNMAYAEKLFIPFQRLHSIHEFPGTGIGLVTVQRIISRHGGRIWPEASLNRGATFYFTLEGKS